MQLITVTESMYQKVIIKLTPAWILCLGILFNSAIIKAQGPPCGTDSYLAEILKTNPEYLKSLTEYKEHLSHLTPSETLNKKGALRTIPVVFHVIHTYGDENISKEQIDDQMKILNEAYQRLHADTTSTRTLFKGVAAKMDIEFKLARVDPSGNCTEGVTRTFSYLTDGGDEAVKNLVRWDYRKYLNIWVVKYIARDATPTSYVLGYATLPTATNSTTDGIVILSRYVGNIGTGAGNGNKGRVLVHEAGHWLGLFHPFQGGCGGSCNSSGDYVCDTPPVEDASYGCPTTNNTCINDFPDQVDMVENFMDYANGSCQNMFTKGQKAVVDYALGRAPRSSNITTANLTSTGVFTAPTCRPTADFYTTNNVLTICQGGTVNFEDFTYNGAAITYEWSFDGGSPSTSAQAAPAIVYNTPGTYKVSLKVSNSLGNSTKVADKMIQVIPTESANKTPVSEGFESTQVLISSWKVWENGQYGWKRTTTNKYEGTAGMVAVIDDGTASNSTYSLVSAPYDISSIKGRLPKLRFRVAYRPAMSGSTEILTVFVSSDCGQSWKALKAYANANGLGVDKVVQANWSPASPSDWIEQTLDLLNYEGSKNLMFKFEARSRSGNSIFLDNVNIQADLAGNGKLLNPNGLSIQVIPNPSHGIAQIDVKSDGRTLNRISIVNSKGQVIEDATSEIKSKIDSYSWKTGPLDPGVYFVHVVIDGQLLVKKFVVIP